MVEKVGGGVVVEGVVEWTPIIKNSSSRERRSSSGAVVTVVEVVVGSFPPPPVAGLACRYPDSDIIASP